MNEETIDQAFSFLKNIGSKVQEEFHSLNNAASLDSIEKSQDEIVTRIDKKIEIYIRNLIRCIRPNDRIIGEEFGSQETDSAFCWHIDPIDGTNNLIRNYDQFSINIGFSGESPACGLIIYPPEDRFIVGSSYKKIFYNSRPFKRDIDRNSKQKIYIGLPSRGLEKINHSRIFHEKFSYRMSGAVGYDLGKMSLGMLDARIGGTFFDYDVVAGVALLRSKNGLVLNGKLQDWSIGDPVLNAYRNNEIAELLTENGVFESD